MCLGHSVIAVVLKPFSRKYYIGGRTYSEALAQANIVICVRSRSADAILFTSLMPTSARILPSDFLLRGKQD